MGARSSASRWTPRPRKGSLALGVVLASLLVAPLAGAAEGNALVGIDVEPRGDGRLVRIRTEGTPTFTVFRLSDPMRVVVDVSGGDVSRVNAPISVEDGILGEIAVRQFSSDGFRIARVMVGFDHELPYEVFADGNSVVVATGEGAAATVGRVSPPPVAPADRAAAERFDTARAEADEATRRAERERKAADDAAGVARHQQEEALRVAAEADRRAAEATAAKAEAEKIRRQAKAAADQDRAAAQASLAQAEERLRLAEDASRRVATERAEAERLAAQARRAQSDAEEAAAVANAKAKLQKAELEERIARAQNEQRAAEAARERAAKAKLEAETAQRAAVDAKLAAERVRTETTKRLQEIAAREAQLDAERKALAADRQKLEGEKAALAERQRVLAVQERERAAQAERDRLAKAEQERAAQVERDRLAKAEQERVAQAERDRLAKAEQERLAQAARASAKPTVVTAVATTTAAVEPAVATTPATVKPAVATTTATVKPAVATEAAEHPLRCTGIKASNGRIVVSLDGEPEFETERVNDPPRLVIDVQNATRATRKTSFDVKLPWAQKARLGDHGDTLRVVVDLASSTLEPQVTASPDGLVITMPAKAATPTPAPTRAMATTGAGGPAADPTGDGGPPPAAETAAATTAAIATVKDIRFERQGRKARVVVELSGTPTALVDDRSSKTWVLQLRDTRVPKTLERSLDTAAYETAVRMVSVYQATESPLVTNIVAKLGGATSQSLAQHGNLLVWEIEGDAAPATAAVSAGSAPQTAAFASEAAVVARTVPRAETVQQKRVNMRLKDADLVNVIRFIADVTGENIIVSEDVKGKVTVNLRNVPWEQALDTILRSRGYDKVRANNIIRIATAEEIQKEREREVAKRKALIESGDTTIQMIAISYATAKELVEQLKPMLTPRGSIQVDERTNTLVVEDLRDNMSRILELAKRLDRQTPQVLIEARIVEASSSFVQEIGIQWGGVGQATSQYGTQTGLSFPGNIITSGGADDATTINAGTLNPGHFAVNLPAAVGQNAGGAIGFIFGSANGSSLLSLRLSALESNGTGRIISSPRIATLDNRTAKIAQGIDIPISTTSAAGTNTRFIPANLELEVTPHVTNDGTVSLKLKTSKNEPDFTRRGAAGDPTIVKKAAETEVMVRDGDTAVIGGIYTRNTSETYAEVPFFSKIPVLGWLFKKRHNEDTRAELLIFITPRIINRESSLASAGGSAITPSGSPPAPGASPTPLSSPSPDSPPGPPGAR